MVSDLDIYRAANLVIGQHGFKGATDHVADHIADLMEKNNHEGAAVWRRIRTALPQTDIRFKVDPVN